MLNPCLQFHDSPVLGENSFFKLDNQFILEGILFLSSNGLVGIASSVMVVAGVG